MRKLVRLAFLKAIPVVHAAKLDHPVLHPILVGLLPRLVLLGIGELLVACPLVILSLSAVLQSAHSEP